MKKLLKILFPKHFRIVNICRGVTYMECREDGLSLWGRKSRT